MRILVVFTSQLLASRGTPSRSRNLVRTLAAHPDNELLVLSRDPAGSLAEVVDAEHQALSGAEVVPPLETAVARFQPAIVYGHTDKAVAPLARLQASGPCTVVDLHGDPAAEKLEQTWKPLPRRLRAFVRHRLDELRWLGKMDGFTVVSEHLRERVQRFGKPTCVVWGGVDPELFRAPPAVAAPTLTVAYAGNFRPYQGLGILVEAMARLDRRFHLLLMGDPTGGEPILKRARRLLGDRLTVLESVPYAEVPELLATADILTVPRPPSRSGRFGFPSKLPEYLALGRAVVVTDLGEQANVVRNGENGLVVRAGSTAALAEALLRLADDNLRRRLGLAARRDAETRLSWGHIGEQLQEFLQRLVDCRQRIANPSGQALGRAR